MIDVVNNICQTLTLGYAKSGARVSLSCSSKRLFAHACFAPQSIALAPGEDATVTLLRIMYRHTCRQSI